MEPPVSAAAAAKKWRKVLYLDSGFPDNYVDASFLDEMKKNISTRLYSWRRVVSEAAVVSRQLSCVSLFLATFAFLSLDCGSPRFVLGVAAVAVAVGFVALCLLDGRPVLSSDNGVDIAKCLPYLGLCYGSSPVLITLTRTISEDTVYAMTALMLFAYLIFYDYRPAASMTSAPVSLNAALFASTCLASRLPTVAHTFAIVSLALVTFALWPVLHRRLGVVFAGSACLLHALTLVLIGASTASVSYFSVVAGWLLVASHFVIVVFCPCLFVRLQKDKHNIYGPWDEAVIKD